MAVLATILAQRAVELVVSRRNERRLLAAGGIRLPRDGFLPIAFVHATLYLTLPLEWFTAPWTGLGRHTGFALALAALAMSLRYWAAWTLGRRYTVRVIRMPDVPLTRRGPYRWMRHPIYRAVVVEVCAVPLAFGAVATCVALAILQGVVLSRRIRLEERHLRLA